MSQSRNDLPQIIVFLVLILVVLGIVMFGSSQAPSAVAVEEATVQAIVAPTAETTAEAATVATPEASAEATTVATVEATTEATAAPTAETTAETTASVAPHVYFISPTNGETVPATFTVKMGADGLTVEPAGTVHAGAGHFHILIDQPFIAAGQAIPKDDTHLHFGQGQTTAQLTLAPGKHTLRLQFANGDHIALDGAEYRDEITVTVK